MNEEILINVTPQETRVAIVENGVLQELYIERARKRGSVGKIFKGKIVRVLPGMQAAFVDIGLERTGFLHSSDLNGVGIDSEPAGNGANGHHNIQPIEAILHEGQEILVQVLKDPLGSKGARLTTRLSIASRYLVFLPDSRNLGVSQRIDNAEERERLRELILTSELHRSGLAEEIEGPDEPINPPVAERRPHLDRGGFILRTAAEGRTREEIHKDIEFLHKLWDAISRRIETVPAPGIVHEDLPLSMRVMRDRVHTDIEKILIDSRETFQKLTGFARDFMPELQERIEHYAGERPLLNLYAIEDEIQRSLNRKVQLKSGGYLIIDQTEAMTTIDVNTGAYVGHRNQEETIYKTNLEAAQAIARQLRLRNLGGIIIIDFIDMREQEHARQVLRALEKSLERDHSKVTISELTSLGLVQLTRKRTRESLEQVLCETCPTCAGRGTIKTGETVCYEIFREILREVRQFDARKLLVVASQQVVDMCHDELSDSIAELEQFIQRPIAFQAEPLYSQEQYEIVLQ
ncbi:MAG: Rne/Rng family ribonuclease [Gammaproteobacteria bacterium]|jgi:ribonuclease G|nr:MAG: Rne/Rng family ribonuclease [Gammaproteobacteria bacterium]